MSLISLSCMEIQLEQWSHSKGKNGTCQTHWCTLVIFMKYSFLLVSFFYMNHIGIFLSVFLLWRVPKKVQWGPEQCCVWSRVPRAALWGGPVTAGLGIITAVLVWGQLEGRGGTCLLAQGTLLGPAGNLNIHPVTSFTPVFFCIFTLALTYFFIASYRVDPSPNKSHILIFLNHWIESDQHFLLMWFIT